MLAKTHLAFGLLIGIIFQYFFSLELYLIIIIISIGSLFPDIDKPNSTISSRIPVIPRMISIFSKHRGMFHSLFFAFLIPYAMSFFLPVEYALIFGIGYAAHILLDSFTLAGINFLHPFAKLHMSGFIQTGKSGEMVLFLVIVGFIMFALI